ncbi:MAG: hypothetical protein ACYDD5_00465 [Sulfuricurvum sp.]
MQHSSNPQTRQSLKSKVQKAQHFWLDTLSPRQFMANPSLFSYAESIGYTRDPR